MRRYAIESTLEVVQGQEGASLLFWNFTAWRRIQPDHLLDRAGAEAELSRLKASLRHDHTLRIVDVEKLFERGRAWSQAFGLAAIANGYNAMPQSDRRSERGKALRRQAVEQANAAVVGWSTDPDPLP